VRLRMLPSPLRFSAGRSVHGCYEIIFVFAPIFAPSLCRFTLIVLLSLSYRSLIDERASNRTLAELIKLCFPAVRIRFGCRLHSRHMNNMKTNSGRCLTIMAGLSSTNSARQRHRAGGERFGTRFLVHVSWHRGEHCGYTPLNIQAGTLAKNSSIRSFKESWACALPPSSEWSSPSLTYSIRNEWAESDCLVVAAGLRATFAQSSASPVKSCS
jgi:hypothetical protein